MQRLAGLIILGLLTTVAAWGDSITLKDGTVVKGVYLGGTSRTITFQDEKGTNRRFDIQNVKSVEFGSEDSPASAKAADPATNSATQTSYVKIIPTGAEIVVRTNESIDSKTAGEGQKFTGVVNRDVLDSQGIAAIPKGSNAELVIRKVSSGGTLSSAELALDIDSITVNGQQYAVSTTDLGEKNKQGIGKNKRTAEMVGGGAGLGALIGAIAGQGKGAAIGAAIGAAAGGTAQVLTRGKEVNVPAETLLTFRLDHDLRLQRAQ